MGQQPAQPVVDESVEPARWETAVPDEVLAEVEQRCGHELPPAWKAFVQRDRWVHRAWLPSGTYVWLDPPAAAL